MNLENSILLTGGVLTALHAGLLYDFSVDIVPAMRSTKGATHISMMQAINRKIENPVFFLSFFGPVVLLPWATIMHWGKPQFPALLTASIIQLIFCQGVTITRNIPLNHQLAMIDISHLSEIEADRIRKEFQGPKSPWMRFHTIRTVAAVTTTAILFWVCLSK